MRRSHCDPTIKIAAAAILSEAKKLASKVTSDVFETALKASVSRVKQLDRDAPGTDGFGQLSTTEQAAFAKKADNALIDGAACLYWSLEG